LSNATPEEIEAFLEKCRKAIDSSFYLYMGKPKNRRTIIELGYTPKNVKDEIKTLSVDNFSEGPKPDYQTKEMEWVFGKVIGGREIYIVIMLSRFNDPGDLIPTLWCWSFHYPEKCLQYPYKK
jgi:hypothetical protein